MRLLVTGGSGFMGSNYIYHILDNKLTDNKFGCLINYSKETYAIHNRTLEEAKKTKEFVDIEGDILDTVRFRNVMTSWNPNVVVHFAAETHVDRSFKYPEEFMQTNFIGTFRILEVFRSLPKIHRPIMIHISTDEVFGDIEHGRVDEAAQLKPQNPYCFDEDTEILTITGWKKYNEIKLEDLVATINLNTMQMEFQQPIKIFIYDYDGIMLHQKSRQLDIMVTPNHRMLVDWKGNKKTLAKPHFVIAKETKGKPYCYQVAASWNNKHVNNMAFFDLPKVCGSSKKGTFQPKLVEPIPIEFWLAFMGWYLSEGHYWIGQNKHKGNYRVCLSTKDRVNEAKNIFRNMGLRPHVEGHKIVVCNKQLASYLKMFGKAKDKYIPKELKQLSSDKLEILLMNLLNGDGTKQGYGWRYTSISKQLADDVQEIAIKIGFHATVSHNKHYSVNIQHTRITRTNLDKDRSKWTNYKGKIWCVNTPNQTVLVRRSGKPYFSGNSASKAAIEGLLYAWRTAYGLDIRIIRPTNNYGPRQHPEKLIAKIIARCIADKPYTLWKGNAVRNWLHVKDLANAIDLVIKKGISGEAYNVSSLDDLTVNQINTLITKIMGKQYLFKGYKGQRLKLDQRYALECDKIHKLGWRQRQHFKTAILDIIEWYKKNPWFWECVWSQ